MSYKDFKFPQVLRELGLTAGNRHLFGEVPPTPPTGELADRLRRDQEWAVAVHTEKAVSECLIAPLLLELRAMLPGRCSVFSGVELDGDASRRLSGTCDFLISRSPFQFAVEAPVLVVAECKPDSTHDGLGQCIAEMVAAQAFNERAGNAIPIVFGVSTCGTRWKFLQLEGAALTLDLAEYAIDDPGRILGILRHIVESA